MPKTIALYHGALQIPISYETPKSTAEADAIVAKAKAELTAHVSGLTADHLARFDANLRAWMASGTGDASFMSLNRALDGAAPTAKTSVLEVFHAANEIEMRGRRISDPAGGIGYSQTVAATGDKVGKWDRFALTADQVNEAHTAGCIEVVFGKEDVKDAAELSRRATVMKLLEGALAAKSGGKLAEGLSAFNAALAEAAKVDPGLARYKLNTVSADIDIALDGPRFLSVQTNVEVDLRKLGDPKDKSIPALFTGVGAASERAMFEQARRSAGELVDRLLRPTASELHGGRYDPKTIKLDKLRAIFTLLLYSTAKVKGQGSKGAWPILPKAGSGDLIRETLNVRDKLTLLAHTKGPGELREARGRALHGARQGQGRARDGSHDRDRGQHHGGPGHQAEDERARADGRGARLSAPPRFQPRAVGRGGGLLRSGELEERRVRGDDHRQAHPHDLQRGGEEPAREGAEAGARDPARGQPRQRDVRGPPRERGPEPEREAGLRAAHGGGERPRPADPEVRGLSLNRGCGRGGAHRRRGGGRA